MSRFDGVGDIKKESRKVLNTYVEENLHQWRKAGTDRFIPCNLFQDGQKRGFVFFRPSP